MFIREALITDLDAIADCGERFFEYAEFEKKGLTMDRESFKEMVAGFIDGDGGIVLLLVDGLTVAGGICGTISPWGFNKAVNICLEVFYWVDEKYRGLGSMRLFNEYEKAVAESKADASFMVSVDTHMQEKVNSMYDRKGYKPLEQLFTKTV